MASADNLDQNLQLSCSLAWSQPKQFCQTSAVSMRTNGRVSVQVDTNSNQCNGLTHFGEPEPLPHFCIQGVLVNKFPVSILTCTQVQHIGVLALCESHYCEFNTNDQSIALT